jgi:hypothetical protein
MEATMHQAKTNLSKLVKLDTLNTDRQDQNYIRKNILDFLKNMQPGVRVAIIVLGSNLRRLQGFTTDSSALRAAVNDGKNGLSMEADRSVTQSNQDKLLAYDRDGNAVNWAGVTQGMDLASKTYAAIQKSGVPVHLEIDLPNAELYLESGDYDWISSKAGTLEVPVDRANFAAVVKSNPE